MDLLAQNLQAARLHRGYSQEEAARRADIKVGLLSRWEQARAWIDPGHLKILAATYKVAIDDLYEESFRSHHPSRAVAATEVEEGPARPSTAASRSTAPFAKERGATR